MSVLAGEQEHVSVGVGARERVAVEPAEQLRGAAEARPQRVLLRAAAGELQPQARVALAGAQERVGEQVDPLLPREAAGVQHDQLAVALLARAQLGREAREVHATVPAADPLGRHAQLAQRRVGRGARRQDAAALAVEGRHHRAHRRLDARVGGAQARVGGQLGVVGADDRHAEQPRDQRRRDPRRAGRDEVDEVVAALGQRLGDGREARHADLQPGVEGDVDLGDDRQAPVDLAVAADDLDLIAGQPALADLAQRVRHAVHPAEAVGHERHAHGVGSARRQLRLLAREERLRRHVRDDGDARREQLERRAAGVAAAALRRAHRMVDRRRQPALVRAAGAAREVAVREVLLLQPRDQAGGVQLEADRTEPRAHEPAAVLGREAGGRLAAACVALAQQPFAQPHDGQRVRRRAAVAAERADGERDRAVRPLGGAALLAAGLDAAGAQVREELLRRPRRRRLRVGAADVDAGMVVGAGDADAAVRLDIDGGGRVQLRRARAVAHLPDREQLGEAAPVARRQRRLDGVERMRERARDLVLVQVGRALLDVARVLLEPVVVVGRDAEAEDVHRLRLAAEPGRQLLGDEDVRPVGELQAAVDRVVVGDGDEVHPAPLGELVDLLRRGGALRQADVALDAELRQLAGGGVAVQVGPAGRREADLVRVHAGRIPAKCGFSVTSGGTSGDRCLTSCAVGPRRKKAGTEPEGPAPAECCAALGARRTTGCSRCERPRCRRPSGSARSRAPRRSAALR